MLCYLLKIVDDIVSFLIQVFLTEAENHVQQKLKFDDCVQNLTVLIFWLTESRVVGIREDVVDGGQHHHQVKLTFPFAISGNDEFVQKREVILVGVDVVVDVVGHRLLTIQV